MPRYYYGTVPALTWIINHYFYAGVHYSWLAAEFHPLETNPKSSNPYLIYGDLYAPWAKHDPYDKYVNATRQNLERAVRLQHDAGILDPFTMRRLREICLKVGPGLFYPVVYRVDIETIAAKRWEISGSGTAGSREVLVRDLREPEFDLLFTDNVEDPVFARLVLDERAGVRRTSPAEALDVLETRMSV